MPDLRAKINEYIDEIDVEINRCVLLLENDIDNHFYADADIVGIESRIQTLNELKCDLKSRLDEQM